MSNESISPEAIQEQVNRLLPELIDFREDLHRHPELSWQEHRTTDKIQEKLAAHGLKHFRRVIDTGGIVDFEFKKDAPYVLLRADIDALPLQDEKQVTYRSRNEGVCHACAHDVHTTTALGTALAIQALKPDLSHNLRFVFQPAEEPIPSGAPEMIANGALEDVAYALGMHMEPRIPLNTIGLTAGRVNMQSIRIDLTLKGPGGHSARPSDTADLVWIASRIVQDSYQIIYREVNLMDNTVVLTFTEIHAAQGYNVIPGELKLTGTIRLADPAKKLVFYERFRKLLKHLEDETGCTIDLNIQEGSEPILNDKGVIDQLTDATLNGFWLPVGIDANFRTPGTDDFSHYVKDIPGAYVRFGVGTEQHTATLHEGLFDVPKEVINIAVSFFTYQLLNFKP